MFNAPRPSQPYGSSNGFGGSSYDGDPGPLAASIYDSITDPWSTAPTPSPPPAITISPSSVESIISNATIPAIYEQAFNVVSHDHANEVSVSALSRVISSGSLSAAMVDKIVGLVSSKPRVTRTEFYVALTLVALVQSGQDASVEQVAALAKFDNLLVPTLDLASIPPSGSVFHSNGNSKIYSPPAYAPDDPWSTPSRLPASTPSVTSPPAPGSGVRTQSSSAIIGTGLAPGWWDQEKMVKVALKGLQGFILKRYTVYEVTSPQGKTVPRRYSEFIFLYDCLVRRYPFRLIPPLPPKRLGPDEHFIEQRRKGLARFLSFLVNHPIVKEDGLLSAFLSEPSLENWRKRTALNLDEESATKRVDRNEEMNIPSDLEEKMVVVKARLGSLIDNWQKICMYAERLIKRREGAASDLSRLALTLKTVNEINHPCWRSAQCDFHEGVEQGTGRVAARCQRHADLLDLRSRTLLNTTLETLKSQRDLYIATRDMFIRHERLSGDQVDALKKKVATNSIKMDGIKATQKDGWKEQADKIAVSIEKDNATIQAQLHRRLFIRACLWHELRVVLHNRENALITQAVHIFAREEQGFADQIVSNWTNLVTDVDDMPYE